MNIAQRLALNKAIADELAREKVKREYWRYAEYVHEGRWIPAKHLLFVCDKVQAHIEGRLKQILIIQMPPQHGKSQSVTETLPSYYLGRWPHKRVIEVSYGDDLAQRFGRRNKQKIQQFGKELFDIEIATDRKSDTEFEIQTHKGSMISRGIMSGITGQPGDLIIIDDPIKNRQEADSETYRERMWDEFLNSILTRLSADGRIILIQTRWHEDDLAGRIIKYLPDKCEVVNLPCEAEDNDPLGRSRGEALFPDMGKDDNWLNEFKKAYQTQEGTRAWLALFQGRPTAEEGNLIKRSWWKYYKVLPQIMYKIMSIDASVKDKEQNDYTSIQVWGKTNTNIYLIDRVKARMDFPATLRAIQLMQSKHTDINAIYIEDKANGSPIIQVLRPVIGGIIPVNPVGDKVFRVNAISPLIEAGNCYLPENEPFTIDFVEECAAFPNGTHDDDVDAMSQALLKIKDIQANLPNNNGIDTFLHRDNSDSEALTESYINMGR